MTLRKTKDQPTDGIPTSGEEEVILLLRAQCASAVDRIADLEAQLVDIRNMVAAHPVVKEERRAALGISYAPAFLSLAQFLLCSHMHTHFYSTSLLFCSCGKLLMSAVALSSCDRRRARLRFG